MKFARFAGSLLVVVGGGLLLHYAAAPSLGQNSAAEQEGPAAAGDAFQKFWSAGSPAAAEKLADGIVRTGIGFDDAYGRLQAGRPYTPQPSGVIQGRNRTSDGVEHFYFINIPANYDPARKYQVRFQLHGGVGGRTDNKPRGNGEIGALAGAEQIYVLPYAWDEAGWWSDDQVLNLRAITDSLKRTYNVDENRVVVAGVSDGATGAYFIAMRETTLFASFLPLNGFIMVLGNQELDDGRIFPNNLLAKPWFVINGGLDRLYPIRAVQPYTQHLTQGDVSIEYHPQPDGEHNTRWWPEMKGPFEQFVASHPRDPHPDRLSWEAVDNVNNRSHWLVIERFGRAAGEATSLPDLNDVKETSPLYAATGGSLFTRLNPSGRVDLVRKGNTVEAATRGVLSFRLLLSPEEFDFAQPIRVITNGRVVFNARVEKSLPALLKWAARDNDRSMLYGAELQITLPR